MTHPITFTTSYDDNNVFAQILRGDLPNVTVLETATCLAFMDLMPQAIGHTLVIPKIPAVTLLDLPPAAAQELICCTQRVAQAVQKAMQADGFSVVQLNGSAAGQTVPHIHFHVIPGSILGAQTHGLASRQADTAELEAIANKIKACL